VKKLHRSTRPNYPLGFRFLTLVLLASVPIFGLYAAALPENKDLIRGQLENRFNYLLFPLEKENPQLSIRLVIGVGSLNEDEDEQGIAHIIEHMAFGSTQRFSRDDKLKYREKAGMTFGSHDNAFTGFTHTGYMFDIPVGDASYRQIAFSILRDTADGLLFDAEELEKARKVVMEEHYLRFSKEMPVWRQWLEAQDAEAFTSRYPIGERTVIEQVDQKSLRAFYQRWYQPGLMTLIVVGNFDVEQIQEEIEKEFSSLAPTSIGVSSQQTKAAISPDPFAATSKNAIASSSMLISQVEKKSVLTEADYQNRTGVALLIELIRGRLKRANTLLNPRFNSVSAARTTDAMFDYVTFSVSHEEDQSDAAVEFLAVELNRLKKHGVTEKEVEHYKQLHLTRARNLFPQREVANSSSLAGALVQYVMSGSTFISSETRLEQIEQLVTKTTLKSVNEGLKVLLGRQKSLFSIYAYNTTKPKLNDLVASTASKSVTRVKPPGIELVSFPNRPTAKDLSPGTIVKETSLVDGKVTEWHLSNGAKVLLFPNKKEKKKIMLMAFRVGGVSRVPEDLLAAADLMGVVMLKSGIEGITIQQLGEYLSSQQIGLNPFIAPYFNGFNMSFNNDKVFDALEVLHLVVQDNDLESGLLGQLKQVFMSQRQKLLVHPLGSLQMAAQESLFPDSSHLHLHKPSFYNEVEEGDITRVYQNLFGNSAEFVYVFAGDFEIDSLRVPVSRFLASLPAVKGKVVEAKREILAQTSRKLVNKESPEDRSMLVYTMVSHSEVLDLSSRLSYLLLNTILQNRLLEEARVNQSLVYAIQVQFEEAMRIKKYNTFQVLSRCAPGKEEQLEDIILAQFDDLAANPVSKKELADAVKAVKFMMKSRLAQNSAAIAALTTLYVDGIGIEGVFEYNDGLDKIDAGYVQQTMKAFWDPAVYVETLYQPKGFSQP